MKKTIFALSMGVLCAMTSCTRLNEKAYNMEQSYKFHKSINSRDTVKYRNEFMRLYFSMTYEEKQEYKKFREEQNILMKEMKEINDVFEHEASEMLNE